MYGDYQIESIRILPNDKEIFKSEDEFKAFFEDTMVQRGGEYYFPNLMMNCPLNTYVLFQYDGMIRAVGVLIELGKKSVFDENGVEYAGFYRFDVNTLHYLDEPIDKDTLKIAYPQFSGFSQSKQKIPVEYLSDIIAALQKKDVYFRNKNEVSEDNPTSRIINGLEKKHLLLKKTVDWSLINWGLTLPIDMHSVMGSIEDSLLQKGEKKDIKLVIDDELYNAKIVNEKFDTFKYPNRTPLFQLRYNKDVAEVIQQKFKETSEYLFLNHQKEKVKKTLLPDSLKAYVSIYTTNEEDIYYFECEALQNDSENNLSDKIYEELSQLNLNGESREAVIKVRVNQSIFREKLLQRYSKCCMCGVSDEAFLIASHIKPWSESEPNEKLDVENGFLMCPNHDKAFDQGWITFNDEGEIIISNRLKTVDRIFLNINDDAKVQLTERNKRFLQYHRKNIFKND